MTRPIHAPDTAGRPWDWRRHAACRADDTDLFFPIGDTGPALVQLEKAKEVCRRCPVLDECLADVLKAEAGHGVTRRYGVFGGLTGNERWKLARAVAR